MADEAAINNIMDDSLDILADIKLDGPSESESSGRVKEQESGGTDHHSTDTPDTTSTLLQIPTPSFHPPSDPPYCDRCVTNDNNAYFSLSCKSCEEKLEKATISQILAIMRQWSPTTQRDLLFYIEKVKSLVFSLKLNFSDENWAHLM